MSRRLRSFTFFNSLTFERYGRSGPSRMSICPHGMTQVRLKSTVTVFSRTSVGRYAPSNSDWVDTVTQPPAFLKFHTRFRRCAASRLGGICRAGKLWTKYRTIRCLFGVKAVSHHAFYLAFLGSFHMSTFILLLHHIGCY